MTKETLQTIKRHLIGALKAVELYELKKKDAFKSLSGAKFSGKETKTLENR